MNNRVDYEQVAAKLDYAAVDKKLAQLAEREPPKKRKTVADVLEPLRERLLAFSKNSPRKLKRFFADTDCFRVTSTGPERLQFIVQNPPKLFFALHGTTSLR